MAETPWRLREAAPAAALNLASAFRLRRDPSEGHLKRRAHFCICIRRCAMMRGVATEGARGKQNKAMDAVSSPIMARSHDQSEHLPLQVKVASVSPVTIGTLQLISRCHVVTPVPTFSAQTETAVRLCAEPMTQDFQNLWLLKERRLQVSPCRQDPRPNSASSSCPRESPTCVTRSWARTWGLPSPIKHFGH